MPRFTTLGEVVTAAMDLADVTNLGSPTAAEVKVMVSHVLPWLWNILTRSGHSFAEKTHNFAATDGISGQLSCPQDLYAKLRVDRVEGGQMIPVPDIDVREIHLYSGAAGGFASAHRLIGDGLTNDWIVLYPTPGAGQVYRLTYVPTPAKFTAISDNAEIINGVSGFEDLIHSAVALKIARKEHRNTRGFERDIQVMVQRIEEEAQSRELLKTGRILSEDDIYIGVDPMGRRPWVWVWGWP